MTDMREDERERIGRLANEICGCSTLEQHRRDIALIEAEIDRRVAEERAKLLELLREPSVDLAASLAAAISLLERGGKAAKKAAPSDKMFDQMVEDYKAALNRARKALAAFQQENSGVAKSR